MKAAIYARKSTDQTGISDEERSVTRQIEHARAYASHQGWAVDQEHVFSDDGVSGAEFNKRPGFLRLMNALKPRPLFQVLVMSEESRLGREQIETAYALKQIMQAGVRVFYYLEQRERTLEGPMDKLLLSVTAFADELERDKARQRTYDAMLRKARVGHVTGGRVFGYDNREVLGPPGPDGRQRRLHVVRQINEAEAEVVRNIFQWFAAGRGYSAIAKTLNEIGALAPRPRRGPVYGWDRSSIREVLHRPLYRGDVVWNRTRKRDAWGRRNQQPRAESERVSMQDPALRVVPEDLWRAVAERLATTRAAYLGATKGQPYGRPPSTRESRYLLTGLATCGMCGGTLYVRSRSHGRGRRERITAAPATTSGAARSAGTTWRSRWTPQT